VKIVLISFLFDVEVGGGAANAVRMLAEWLVKQGIEVVVITTHPQKELSIEHLNGFTIYRFFPKNLYWVGEKDGQPLWKKVLWQMVDIWNPFSYRVVRQILATEQPDLVHIHKLRGLSPSVWAAAQSLGIEVIQTCHDYELMSPEGTLSGRVGTWAKQGHWLMYPYQMVRANSAKKLAAVTAPSQYVLDTFGRQNFLQSVRNYVVPNSHGLANDQLEELQKELSVDKQKRNRQEMRLLYLGRLETIKGVDVLCEAFIQCMDHFPHLYLDIVGWGTLESILKRQYGQYSGITFHGPVFGQHKVALLKQSDVLVVPSIWPEVFGIVIAEAFAYGLPVIASQIGGIPELVDDKKTGFLIPPGKIKTLIETISLVAENPKAIRQMAPACFLAAKQFSSESVHRKYLSIYE